MVVLKNDLELSIFQNNILTYENSAENAPDTATINAISKGNAYCSSVLSMTIPSILLILASDLHRLGEVY